MKFIIDMNLTTEWATYLSAAGWEVAHWSTIGEIEALDEAIASYARTGGWWIVTRDLDFGHLAAQSSSSAPSIIQIRDGRAVPATIGSSLLDALRAHEVALGLGAIVTVEATRTRVRPLPLARQ
ncbi:MAG: DUF5615 family PIN-like protein [Devosia sp.]